MSENNSKSNHNDYCKFCGDKISVELSKKIKANKENVVCELCGCQLLLITNISKEENRGTELITDIKKEHHKEIREDLKDLYSLNIYSADREKFGYYLTIFMSRSIYNIIKQSNLGINITDIHIEMISNSIIVEIINNRVDNEWLAEFKPIKKKFKKFYKELQSELSLNQALQEVFLEFFRLLAKIIINLIKKKDYSELQGIEYDIAEYLIKRDLFVSNIRFTVPFRYNLKICLSRLIYLRIKDIGSKNKLKFCQLILTEIEYRNMSDEIMKYLTTHNEIINKFLGELESIKTDDFNEFYEYLCLELNSDNLFAESFNYYLRWLIGHVHNIVSGEYKWRELSHFDRIIGTKLAQLINVEVDFEKIREFKEKVQNTVEITQESPVNLEVNELSAEIKNDNFELLKERYKQETGGRAIYAGKETTGFKSWKESLNQTQEELNEEFSEDSLILRKDLLRCNIKSTLNLNRGYRNVAKSSVEKGFTTFSITARHIYEKNVLKFLNYYIVNYDNNFTKQFKNISEVHIIESIEDFNERNLFGSYILYRILNKERQIVRIGYTADATAYRLAYYFSQAFSDRNEKKSSQIHLDIRDLGDIHRFNDKFEFQILCIANTREEIKILERLFTIYENRYDNELGYDLSLNDYYNRIVGDFFDYVGGEFKNSEVHPRLMRVPPEILINAVKECSTWDKILAKFTEFNKTKIKDPITIKRKAVKYGFTIKGDGTRRDMRAFFIKPYLEDLILKNILDPEKIFIFLKEVGFVFLESFATKIWAKRDYLRKLVRYIWKSDMEKIINFQKGQWLLTGLRRLLLYNKAKILMRNPKFNIISKAERELIRLGISVRPKSAQYDGDLLRLVFGPLGRSYKIEQNKVLAPLFITLLIQKDPESSLGQIASTFGLTDTIHNRKLVRNLILRIFAKKSFPKMENVGDIRFFLRNQLHSISYYDYSVSVR